MVTTDDLDTMVYAYAECALWSSSANAAWDDHTMRFISVEDDDRSFVDHNFDVEDMAPEALESMRADCESFLQANADDLEGMAPEQAGHDFWLTRNGHGAGFWDRGLGERGERLTKAAHAYGDSELYLGLGDNAVYVS